MDKILDKIKEKNFILKQHDEFMQFKKKVSILVRFFKL